MKLVLPQFPTTYTGRRLILTHVPTGQILVKVGIASGHTSLVGSLIPRPVPINISGYQPATRLTLVFSLQNRILN
jgi:hypothetical protein